MINSEVQCESGDTWNFSSVQVGAMILKGYLRPGMANAPSSVLHVHTPEKIFKPIGKVRPHQPRIYLLIIFSIGANLL
jgi:hypothetical protein